MGMKLFVHNPNIKRSICKLLKIGGSVITNKKSEIGIEKKDIIDSIAKEISCYKKPLILIHGTGSFGHPIVKKYNLTEKFDPTKIIETHTSVKKLNRMVVDSLLFYGIHAISIEPMSNTICENGKIKQMSTDAIQHMLENGFLPVLFGDIVMDEQKGASILSSDRIITYLAKQFEIDTIGFGFSEDGIYDCNGNTIPEINPKNFKDLEDQIGLSEQHIDVTGGRIGKIKEILQSDGTTAYIFNAKKRGNITRFLDGEKIGTKVISELQRKDNSGKKYDT